jgi:hypothetical protein
LGAEHPPKEISTNQPDTFQLGSPRALGRFAVKLSNTNGLGRVRKRDVASDQRITGNIRDYTSVVDTALIISLLKYAGPDLEGIYGSFFDECQSSIDLLERASSETDPSHVCEIARLRTGASSTFGMLGLAAVFSELQSMSLDRKLPPPPWFVQTRKILRLSKHVIEEMDFNSPLK